MCEENMKSMTAAEIEEYFLPFVTRTDLTVLSIKAEPVDEAPMDELPLVNVRVSLEGVTAREVETAMFAIRNAVSGDLGGGVRPGLYLHDPDDDADDVPEGQALLQFDDLNIHLSSNSVTPRM
jgi:hypothetical protein